MHADAQNAIASEPKLHVNHRSHVTIHYSKLNQKIITCDEQCKQKGVTTNSQRPPRYLHPVLVGLFDFGNP